MKILHIIPTYLPSVNSRGVIDSIHFLNKQLVRRGVEVCVYTINLDGAGGLLNVPTGREVDIDEVKVFYFKAPFFKRWYFSNDMRKRLAKTVADFDIIHITSVFLAQSTMGAYYARKFKKPYIITPHGSFMRIPLASRHSWLKKIYISFVEKRNLKNALLHFMTEAEKNQYLETGLPYLGILLIPNAFELEITTGTVRGSFRRKIGVARDIPLILFLGRLVKIKGLDTLIPAFADVVKQYLDAALVLAGPDDKGYKKNIQLLITNYKLQNKVIFTGMLIGDDKTAAFQGSDIFILPSYSESFGMAAVEAMTAGLPVVVTNTVGVAPDIKEAGAGLVVNRNKEELASAILKILNNKDLARQMGERGRRLASEKFAPAKIAEKWLKAYNELISA